MRKIFKNTSGAVTVFVTLLLIPAILISGTAVDLTRMYTARSIVSDANQLAANSLLSQYDALLYDLYGVFGIAENDPVLAQLLDEYISITVFGKEGRDTTLGTLQLFYGSNLNMDEVYFPEQMHLRNPDVLRRQIEEYMKYRAPVIIVSEFLDILGENTFKEDAEVIEDKLAIDEAIAALHDKYKELYDAIIIADGCAVVPADPAGAAGDVGGYLKKYIRAEFINLKDCYESWKKEDNPDTKADYAKKYNAILVNIQSWAKGGKVGKLWVNGKWLSSSDVQGLEVTIENALNRADRFKPKFDAVEELALQIDSMNAEISKMIDTLEERVNTDQCSEELKIALTAEDPHTDKSMLETYREILKWDDIGSMAAVYKDGGYEYIDELVKPMLSNAEYRNSSDSAKLSLSQENLKNAPILSSLVLTAYNTKPSELGSYGEEDVTYKMPDGFYKFADYPGEHKIFFDELEIMINGKNVSAITLYDGQSQGKGSNSEKKQRNMIENLLELVDDAYAGMTNDILGAEYIESSASGTNRRRSASINEAVTEAASDNVSKVISNPLGALTSAGDYLLLLTYCSSMFSDYTTTRPESNGKSRDELGDIEFPLSAAGIPISPHVNYFFQSEWEYLYNGEHNAGKNLNAISRLIYLVRMICNYITVFSVTEITTVVNSIRAAFSWNPVLGITLGELARAAFVAAESAVDTAMLRSGNKVPLIKKSSLGQWVCSPSGVTGALSDILKDTGTQDSSDDKGLEYRHYLLFFFLAKGAFDSNASTELTLRTVNLIEWNVINYKKSIMCDERKMEEALSEEVRFHMEDMKTDFSITTTADMRMLFLSMLIARNFADTRGLSIPQTYALSVTDYRGY